MSEKILNNHTDTIIETEDDSFIEIPDRIITNGRSDFKSRNVKLTALFVISVLLTAFLAVAALLLNQALSVNEKSGREPVVKKIKLPELKKDNLKNKDNENYKKYREIINRFNNGKSKNERVEFSGKSAELKQYANYKQGDKIKTYLDVVDVIKYVNILAELNGFYRLEKFTLGKRDPNLLFPGEVLKHPDGRYTAINKRDFLWKYAILDLKRNYRDIFIKILKFKKKIRMFEKRKVDNFKKISIMKQGLEKVLKGARVSSQRKLIQRLINRLENLPVIYK